MADHAPCAPDHQLIMHHPADFRRGAQVRLCPGPMSLATREGGGEDDFGKRELVEAGPGAAIQILVASDFLGDRAQP